MCYIKAQVYFLLKFLESNPKVAKQNAQKFAKGNNRRRIAQAKLQFPEAFQDALTAEEEANTFGNMYHLCLSRDSDEE